MPQKFGDQMRASIRKSGRTRYRIWKETGIDQAHLSRFMSGQAGLSFEALDRLAAYMGWQLTSSSPWMRDAAQTKKRLNPKKRKG